ncbi:uncharacterized protein FOMMEDRAFT_28476 [Fomitiporia mediterranea MF3/22]|uniref:uncharacterized protein n=1 Tax=Fomitiporia mediterranea (strain MF3/22) TaxID=694068 RepID=UPI000440897F|nr:uncharacterized protein FOMMEDRAFT_28476 [Fomitiporia mediterranea MF3/22]EJD02806.1 hypothetical protein FOMMEDRAFT_28476 [Fomitiporia mediterranea MF3/22]
MSGNADEQIHTIYNLIASWHECDETWKEAKWTIKLFQENGGIKFCYSKRHREGSKKPSQLRVGLSTENALPNSINVTNVTAMDYPQKGSQKVLFGTEKEPMNIELPQQDGPQTECKRKLYRDKSVKIICKRFKAEHFRESLLLCMPVQDSYLYEFD